MLNNNFKQWRYDMPNSASTAISVSQLSEQDFDNATKNSRMKKKTINIARDVIVNGFSTNEVAKKYDVSPQWVDSACERILKASGFGTVTISFKVPVPIQKDIAKIVSSCVKIYEDSDKGDKA